MGVAKCNDSHQSDREKANSSHVKNRRGTNLIENGETDKLFPEISKNDADQRQIYQKNPGQHISPPGTADASKSTAPAGGIGGVNETNGPQLDVPLGSTGTRRQLANFNVKQRMSHSLAHNQNNADGPVPIDLVNKQSYQH